MERDKSLTEGWKVIIMKYCNNCKQNVEPTKQYDLLALIAGVVLSIVAGGLGMVVLAIVIFKQLLKESKCPICKSTNWRK